MLVRRPQLFFQTILSSAASGVRSCPVSSAPVQTRYPSAINFQYDTGASRSISVASLASEPTMIRGRRCSIPATMISPARSGGNLQQPLEPALGLRRDRVAQCLGHPRALGDRGRDATGMYRGDADPRPRQFVAQGLGEAADSELAGRIGGLARRGRSSPNKLGYIDELRARRSPSARGRTRGSSARRPRN